ncbi:MAG: hypothetical protein HRT51_12940 [Colwellia sp.]|nr:hypothetical protein [Colwellia sp.]
MWNLLPFVTPFTSFIEGVVDSCRDSVIPTVGSIVYCELYCGYAEHSGVYVGNDEIVHLNGNGLIEVVSPKGFMANTTAINIYVSCDGSEASGEQYVADNAMQMLGECRNYNIILDNCHQFISGCISSDFENSCSFMWMLKDEANKHLNTNTWRQWDSDCY